MSTAAVEAATLADDGAVTTTKSFLLQIVAPCKFSAKKQPDDGGDDDDDGGTKATDIGQEEEEEEEENIGDRGATLENGEEMIRNEDDVDVMGSQEITKEEAAAIEQVHSSEDTAVVNVEELLRITFHKLAEDFHLLNIPTYRIVRHFTLVTEDETESEAGINYTIADRAKPVVAIASDYIDKFEWIQVNVMIRPTSLGIILDRLDRIGVGTNCGTLTVLQAELCRTASPLAHMPEEKKEDDVEEEPQVPATEVETKPDPTHKPPEKSGSGVSSSEGDIAKERAIEAARAEWKNAATRLRIEQVREQIVEQAAFSFDFIALLTVASILAGVGLITDNTVVIVASMLVSPIMGPVLGLTFGTRIRDWPLVISSLKHECLALLGCVIIGALVGLGAAFTDLAQSDWPTNEMHIRGEPVGLLTGVAIAIPSGMGVCLSILGGNTSSLVGVAISASLLPPAVNTGICLVFSFFLAIGSVESVSEFDAGDFARIGGISFVLTVINILCIWVSGLIMFEIKEVAPTEKKSAFWAKDLKLARRLNQSTQLGTQERPEPVNLGVIRLGIKAAFNKNSGNNVNEVKLRFGARRKKAENPASVGAAFTHKTHRRNQSNHRYTQSIFQASANAEEDEEVDENVRFVGLEDMARLLGFDEEDEEQIFIDHAAVVNKLGRGRYL